MKLCYVTALSAIVGDKVAYLVRLLETRPDRLILRAKDLDEKSYEALLTALLPHTRANGVDLVLNHQIPLARKYGLKVQVSVHALEEGLRDLDFGVSVHALEEAKKAFDSGAKWLVFGHVFPTACKLGLAPRAMDELEKIIHLGVPTYAIGGIKIARLSQLAKGLEGVYIMRDSMVQAEPSDFTASWRKALKGFNEN